MRILVNMSDYLTTKDAVERILDVLKNEAGWMHAVLSQTNHKKDGPNEEITYSLKRGDKTFRIWLSWVRDANPNRCGHLLGQGQVEGGNYLRLVPLSNRAQPPFQWEVHPPEQLSGTALYILDDARLRLLIRQKLDAPQ